jgi:outer membrane protein OmpA-like peptidoglycan-associated protein
MSKSLYIVSGVALFAVLYVVQWNVYRPRIERDLTRRTLAALENQPFQVTSAQFSGRDGSIQIAAGENPEDAIQAQRLAARVFGVRVASVTVAASQKDAPTLLVERTGENISLRGSVPNASVAALFKDAAQTAFDGMTIKNELRVEPTTNDAPYLRGMRLMIGLLAQTAPEGTLELSQTTVRLSGDVPNSAAAISLQDKAQQNLPRGLELIVELIPAQIEPQRVVAKDALGTLPVLHFEFDSIALTAESTSAFEPLVSQLKSVSSASVRIVGHADSKGSDTYNQKLSLRRAQHIAQLLKEQGLSAPLKIEGRGETQPATDNGTDEGRAQNRRVEFQVLGGG